MEPSCFDDLRWREQANALIDLRFGALIPEFLAYRRLAGQ